jgi:signal peptide peptidase SppA
MTPAALNGLLVAARHPDLNAVAARIGQPLDDGSSNIENRNGTAVLDIRGPLFRYRSIWTWLLGGASIESAAIDLQAALDDPAVRQIVLAINSPGGQIDGINEFANMIRAANQVKPVTAYVDGMAASGAYWLASAAGRIVADETAQLGSIGVLATAVDDSGQDERRGIKRYEVVSSQSPLKRTDPGTDEGRQQLQSMVDALAQVFIEHVAAFRGTSVDRVTRDYGRGAVLPARSAIAVGMADALGSLEGLLQGEANATAPIRQVRDVPGLRVEASAGKKDEESDEDEDDLPDIPGLEEEENDDDEDDQDDKKGSSAKGEGLVMQDEDRQRIAAILTCEEARGREDLARVLALETNHSVEAAKKLLLAAPVGSKKTNPLEARMGQIENPKVGVSGDSPNEESPEAEVRRILAFVPKGRVRVAAR